MWAEVIVDIRTRELDRRFHYAVPQELAGRLQVGHRVGVPFGRRREVEGYVVGITGEPPSVEGVRPIHRLLDDDPVFSPHALAVARWMSESLLCPLAQALQPFLPPGGNLRRARAAGPLERKGYRLALDPAEAQLRLEELRRRAPRQAAALEILIEKPNDVQPARLLAHRANGYGALRALEAKGWIAADRLRQRRTVAHQELGSGVLPPAHPLTAAQEGAVAAARAGLRQEAPVALLLQGVTGSGKTEVYLRAIQEAVDLGGQAIALVPEISLTPQTIERFRARFGGKVAVLHSRLSDGERFDEWERAAAGEVDVVVGVRSAVFAPLPRLSLIVMDEEHETSYKQDEAPRYHAREVAWERIRRVKGLLLLGSATPSLETLRWAEQAAECRRVLLPERIGGRPLPDVEVVDLRAQLLAGNGGMLSRRLQELIEGCLRERTGDPSSQPQGLRLVPAVPGVRACAGMSQLQREPYAAQAGAAEVPLLRLQPLRRRSMPRMRKRLLAAVRGGDPKARR